MHWLLRVPPPLRLNHLSQQPFRLGEQEIRVLERFRANVLPPYPAGGVDQEGAVQRQFLELVERPGGTERRHSLVRENGERILAVGVRPLERLRRVGPDRDDLDAGRGEFAGLRREGRSTARRNGRSRCRDRRSRPPVCRGNRPSERSAVDVHCRPFRGRPWLPAERSERYPAAGAGPRPGASPASASRSASRRTPPAARAGQRRVIEVGPGRELREFVECRPRLGRLADPVEHVDAVGQPINPAGRCRGSTRRPWPIRRRALGPGHAPPGRRFRPGRTTRGRQWRRRWPGRCGPQFRRRLSQTSRISVEHLPRDPSGLAFRGRFAKGASRRRAKSTANSAGRRGRPGRPGRGEHAGQVVRAERGRPGRRHDRLPSGCAPDRSASPAGRWPRSRSPRPRSARPKATSRRRPAPPVRRSEIKVIGVAPGRRSSSHRSWRTSMSSSLWPASADAVVTRMPRQVDDLFAQIDRSRGPGRRTRGCRSASRGCGRRDGPRPASCAFASVGVFDPQRRLHLPGGVGVPLRVDIDVAGHVPHVRHGRGHLAAHRRRRQAALVSRCRW